MLVTVTFRGNITKALGRGHLKNALVALELHPRTGAQLPSGIVTRGAGLVGRTSRRTASEDVGVIRDGSKLHFFVHGAGFENVGRVEVKVFARSPKPAAPAPQGIVPPNEPAVPPLVAVGLWQAILSAAPADRALVALVLGVLLPCPDLLALDAALSALIQIAAKNGAGDAAAIMLSFLQDLRFFILLRCTPFGGLLLEFAFQFFGLDEVEGSGVFAHAEKRRPLLGGSVETLDAVRFVVPPLGTTARQITAFLCPSQLPVGSLSTTTHPLDTLTCTGGTLRVGEEFRVNIRTSPFPNAGMGAQAYGRPTGGEFLGPFAVTGP